MKRASPPCRFTVSSLVFAALGVMAVFSGQFGLGRGIAAAANLDETPAQLVKEYGGRAPRRCPPIRHAPSSSEAAVLVQCNMEGTLGMSGEVLLTGVKVTILGSRKFDITKDGKSPDIDVRTTVLPLAVNAANYICLRQSAAQPGQNCQEDHYVNAPGTCWGTVYGYWRCNVISAYRADWRPNQPPPTHY